MLAAAPSWTATIAVCAVLAPIAVGLSVQMLRELGDAAPGEAAPRRRRPPLPLIVFAGIPVAVLTAVVFKDVAHRDWQLEKKEAAVLCAGTGAIMLLILVDLVRFARRQPDASE